MNSIVHSAVREARLLRQRPWDLAMVSWVPLLGVALLWWIFSAGLAQQLPIGVLDEDHSALSRQITRMLGASPGLRVAAQYTSAAEAEQALRAAQVYGVVALP
ncbi:MAG: ABC transporter permease, partial [Ottowia sp.]|nr:ABC transporter permease [Ottowia sp.]